MRVIRYEAKTKRLTFDFAAQYVKLHNATLVAPREMSLAAGQTKRLALPQGEDAVVS